MSRRLLLLILVPAIVGTMVGVGAATVSRERKAPAAAADTTEEPVAEPAGQKADTPFDLGFDREPSGLKETELAKAKPAPKKTKDDTPDYDVASVQRKLTALNYYV